MRAYDHKKIETKWQKEWEKSKVYRTTEDAKKPKMYVLDMFPYPSGEGLHVGHPKGYIATDIVSRHARMSGKSVLHPMGWDAFGLPAENYAIKNKVHPRKAVEKNVARFKEQLKLIGLDYDWDREINTTDPEFYKWTQWIFLKLYEKGLAYESFEPINWCPSCQTGLANEDLDGNACERCGTIVEKRPMRQWTLKITEYAERLLQDLELLPEWQSHIKESQRNWIGKSEGMLFTSPVKDTDLSIQTFSAHFEAFTADTFVVIAPDHPFLAALIKGMPTEREVLAYAKKMTEEREAAGHEGVQEPDGIFTGRYTVDPIGNGELPIWVANYALANYGTGIVKCSVHDERDFAFAKKYGIRLKPVMFPEDAKLHTQVENLEICFHDMASGVLTEPSAFAGKKALASRQGIIEYLEKNNLAVRRTTYKIRDWVFSRQRYWGEPIPIIHCENDGIVAVPYDQLPIKLPEVEKYEPTGTGESPLAAIDEWVNTTCPKCGGAAKRETNTMPQWAGSSWYYLRYMDPKNNAALVDADKEKYWAPVDLYVGGAEHATRHLIYARFWHKFLYDIGAVSTPEPFTRLISVGLIQAEDGRKMSKRFGNVINPDDIVETYGADTLRVYEMFMGPFTDAIAWKTSSLIGARRFLERVWKFQDTLKEEVSADTERALHVTIKKVGEDIANFKFNTAISQMMIFINEAEKSGVTQLQYQTFVMLLAPFAPHIAEDIWHSLGNTDTVHTAAWPSYDEAKLIADSVTIVVQVNGKVRTQIQIPTDTEEGVVIEAATAVAAKWLKDSVIKKTIFVPNRLINFVID